MNDEDLRQAFALMLTVGLGIDNADINPRAVWKIADALVAAQYEEPEPEVGIKAIRKRRRVEKE